AIATKTKKKDIIATTISAILGKVLFMIVTTSQHSLYLPRTCGITTDNANTIENTEAIFFLNRFVLETIEYIIMNIITNGNNTSDKP
ncbi:MAG: hypothetical protein ACOCWG_04285, partial [bacterium]